MLGREIRVSLDKPRGDDTEGRPTLERDDYAKIADDITGRVLEHVTKTFITYMAVDTARKILINRLSK